VSPPAIRPGSQAPAIGASSVAVATVPGGSGAVVPDVKMIDDHLAVQAIIRAYQVAWQNFVFSSSQMYTQSIPL